MLDHFKLRPLKPKKVKKVKPKAKKAKKVKKVKPKVKKPIKEVIQKDKTFYRILVTSQKKKMFCALICRGKKAALTAYTKILDENKKKVRFPVRYSIRDYKIMPSKYELLLMKSKGDDETLEPLLRNEFGKLVPHIANSKSLIIYKKDEYLFEETFWIYGMNPKCERKEFTYILNEIVLHDLPNVKYPVKTVLIYKNKLIIEDDYGFEMVICKCENDSARLYTELEKEVNKLKLKSVFFSGFVIGTAKLRLEARIMEKTSWDLTKIRRRSTRP